MNVDHLLTFVVVGAGPTGVEMAGQIAELAHRTLKRDFRAINTRQARVILLDAAPQVLPPFGKKLGEHTQKALEKLGVEVILGAMVTDVDERGIDVAFKDGRNQRILAVTKIWAAGVQASSLGRTLAAAERRAARPRRPDRRQPRPHAPGPPRGVRGRRHDRPRQPPRRRPGRHPGSQVRRQVDRAPDRRQAAAAAVQVLRQGLDGDDQPLQGGGPDRQAPSDRLRRLGGVAGAAPDLHHRVQEPAHRPDALVRLVPGPRRARSGPPPSSRSTRGPPCSGCAAARPTWCRTRRLRPRAGDPRGHPPGRAGGASAWRRPGSPTRASVDSTRSSGPDACARPSMGRTQATWW